MDNDLARAVRMEALFEWVTVAVSIRPPEDSGTSPRAGEMSTAPLTAFLGDDETADPFWLHELTEAVAKPYVAGPAGRHRDARMKGKSAWFSSKFSWVVGKFSWVVGGAYEGLPSVTSEVRNVWSGDIARRTQAFRTGHGLSTDAGKYGNASQPEGTDLCIRMAQADGGHWMYVPSVMIDHEVPAMRWVAFPQGMARLCGLACAGIRVVVLTVSLSTPATRKDANAATGHLGTSAFGVLMAPFPPLDVTGGAA